MLLALEILWHRFLLKISYPVFMSVTTGMGDLLWTIYVRSMRITVPIWQVTKRAPNYDSIVLASKLCIVVNLT